MSFKRNVAPIAVVCLRVLGCIALLVTVFTIGDSLNDPSTATTADRSSVNAATQEPVPCPQIPPNVVDIRVSARAVENRAPFDALKDALAAPNTTVRIGPDVELDFDGLESSYFPLLLARCVTLMSVDSFEPGGTTSTAGKPVRPKPVNRQPTNQSAAPVKQQSPRRVTRSNSRRKRARRQRSSSTVTTPTTNTNVARIVGENAGPINDLEVERPPRVASARTPKSRGPLFQFRSRSVPVFLELRCDGDFWPDGGNGVRISGFRVYGKSFGQQSSGQIGIQNTACVNVEISNMEIAGWGGSAINIVDDDIETPAGPGGRISRPDQVRVFGNYIHHNQHKHEQGYGVDVGKGAWAQISHNLFDHNRHAIAASGDSGGYIASYNLVLKGGGIHGRTFNHYTHQFDAHGDENCGIGDLFSDSLWNCGHTSFEIVYDSNAFQYLKDNAIKIRGKPRTRGFIANNVFPHEGFEDDRGDDAVALYTTRNMGFSGNEIEFDSFGKYGVCDFDADGIDDLFLATGASWWYSSAGEFAWSYVSAKRDRPDNLKFGYVDNDLRCDVLTQRNGLLLYSSGGYGDWQTLGQFDAPFKQVTFGRFDPSQMDTRPGATRSTTHAFWQRSDSQWVIVPLASLSQSAAPPWQAAQSSGKELLFGDFTGDGGTDVLAVVGGRWHISRSGMTPWTPHNPHLGDDVDSLKVANMDTDDNIDDILKLERKSTRIRIGFVDHEQTTLIWWRSKNGTERWTKYAEHPFRFPVSADFVSPRLGFVGRFGAAPGGGTLVIGNDRVGVFYSEAEKQLRRAPLFLSVFAY